MHMRAMSRNKAALFEFNVSRRSIPPKAMREGEKKEYLCIRPDGKTRNISSVHFVDIGLHMYRHAWCMAFARDMPHIDVL